MSNPAAYRIGGHEHTISYQFRNRPDSFVVQAEFCFHSTTFFCQNRIRRLRLGRTSEKCRPDAEGAFIENPHGSTDVAAPASGGGSAGVSAAFFVDDSNS